MEKWPDIDDETAISCFRKILNDIREEIRKDESNKEIIANNLKVRKLGPIRWFPRDLEI